MTQIVNTHLTVDYAARDESPRIVLDQDTLEAPAGHALMRMYFAGATPTTLSTSGYPVYTINRDVVTEEVRTITFLGTNKATFPVPNVSNVRVEAVGSFLSPDGNVIPRVSLVVDANAGVVRCDRPIFGTVMATYTTRFHRLQCQFLKLPEAAKDPRYLSEYADMVVTAMRPGDQPEYLTLTGPRKGGSGMGPTDKADGESILLEIDERYPIRLSGTTRLPGLVATCRVWAYSTHSGLRFDITQGLCEADRFNIAESLPIRETVNFVHATSMSVSKPPANGISVRAVSEIVSRQAPGGNLRFATHPAQVNVAEWGGFGLYTMGEARTILENEIAAHSAGILVPVTGQVEASYNTRRTWCDVYWGRQSGADWFSPAILTAQDARNNTASLVLNPPERRGR